MIASLIYLIIFLILTLLALSAFVKIKYCTPIYEYFKNKREEKIANGSKFYNIKQKLLFGTILLVSTNGIIYQLLVSIPNEAGGAHYGVTGEEYSSLNLYNNTGNLSEFVKKYKARKLEGIKSPYDYKEMVAANITTVEEFYQYKKEEAEKRAKPKRDEEIRIANEKAEAKIAEQAAKAGVSVEEFKKKLEQEKAAKESADAAAKAASERANASARAASECKQNYSSCSSNEMLINKYSGMLDAKVACKIEGKKLAKWDTQWRDGVLLFSLYFEGNDYPSTGVIRIQDDDVKFQNGFGAWQTRSVRCKYNLKSKSVDYVEVLEK